MPVEGRINGAGREPEQAFVTQVAAELDQQGLDLLKLGLVALEPAEWAAAEPLGIGRAGLEPQGRRPQAGLEAPGQRRQAVLGRRQDDKSAPGQGRLAVAPARGSSGVSSARSSQWAI